LVTELGKEVRMRWKIPVGVLLALALFIPMSSATAQPSSSGLSSETSCQVKSYKDLRQLITIDLDAASDVAVRVLASQILAAAVADSLVVLPPALQVRLDGTAEDLRAFLKADMLNAWATDLRLAVVRTLPGAGANVQAAADEALGNGTIDAYLSYLNNGLYIARALDSGISLKLYKDLRQLITIDLDAASDVAVRVLASQILAAAVADSLVVLPSALQVRLDGTAEDLRAFLKADMLNAWATDLRLAVVRTLPGAGANMQAAADEALGNGTIDAYLSYLNNGLYIAYALDACASHPAPAPASVN
jgi:hypothetical protein